MALNLGCIYKSNSIGKALQHLGVKEKHIIIVIVYGINHIGYTTGYHSLEFPSKSNIPNTTNIYVFILFTGVEGRSPEFEEPLDLRSNPFQGGENDVILLPKGIG